MPLSWEYFGGPRDGFEEEGTNGMAVSKGSAKKQKWIMKLTHKEDCMFYERCSEMGEDPFMQTVTREEKNKWWPALEEQLRKNAQTAGSTMWYFIYEGPDCGLYDHYVRFVAARDARYIPGVNCASKKATHFYSLDEAKMFIQASRDEEGDHYAWPDTMPIYSGA